jgi:hypothetical protein
MPKVYEAATLDAALERLNDGRTLSIADVRPSIRDAWVHVGYYGMGGGYLPEDSSHYYARSRRAVVESHCDTVRSFEDAARAPNGFRRTLMRGGAAWSRDGRTCFEVDCVTLRELCAR